MGKNQSASNLPNIIQYNNGSINFVSGSTLLMQISSSGAITTTGVISGSNALSSSYAVNADQLDGFDSSSFVFTSSFNTYSSSMSTRVSNTESTGSTLTTASASFAVVSSSYSTASGSLSTRVTRIEGNYATTGSNIFTGAQTVCANITSTGTIIAQTLNVQQVTSSVVYSSGSNVFGCALINTQQFTGSVTITGSLTVTTAGTSPEFQVNSGGTIKGNALTDIHQITGSLRITGSVASFSNCVGIGTISPCHPLHVVACNVYHITAEQASTDINNVNAYATFFIINNAGASQIKGYLGAGGNSVSNAGMQNHVYAGAQTNHGFRLFTNDTARVTIANTGIACFACQVGVGTSPLITLGPSGGPNNSIHIHGGTGDAGLLLSTQNCGNGQYLGEIQFGTLGTASTQKKGATIASKMTAASNSTVTGNLEFYTTNAGTEALRLSIGDTGIATFTCQVSIGPTLTVGNQGGTDTTVIGGGSGVGSSVRMNFAGGAFNNFLAGNGDNFVNCVTGKLNAAGGIKFANGSGTLNYYEVGTWTPQLYWTNGGYYCMGGINGGNYVRIGNVVHVNYQLQWTALCGSSGFSGQLRIGGLPFAVGSLRSAGTISAMASGIGRSSSCITYHANTVDPGANFVYWIENDPSGGYSHSPSVGASGLVYSNQVTYIV